MAAASARVVRRISGRKSGLACVAAILFAGCATTPPAERPARTETAPPRPPATPAEGRERAEALAHYAAGISAQLNGAYPDALNAFERVIELDPFSDDAYIRAAALHLQLNQPAEAVATILRLTGIKPDDLQSYIWYGAICAAAGQRRESYLAFRRAIQIDPFAADGYKELATNYIRDNEPEKAILVLERGAERVRQPAILLALLGELYLHKVRTSRDRESAAEYSRMALLTFERAALIDPDSIPILEQLSALYIVNDQIDRSEATLRRLYELKPDDLQVQKQLALVYGALEKPFEASRILEEIARKTIVDPRAYYYVGELYEKLGETDNAILNFRLATQMDPPEPAPFLHLALLTLENSPDEAIAYLLEGLEKLPAEPRILQTLAYIHMGRADYETAIDYFRQLHGKKTSGGQSAAADLSLLFNYAIAAHHARRHELAARLLQQAAGTDPLLLHAYLQYVFQQDDPVQLFTARKIHALMVEPFPEQRITLLTNLALLFSFQQDYPSAVELFAQAYREARETEQEERLTDQFFYWYGATLERLGRIDEAAWFLRRTIELNPDHAPAYNHIAYMWAERGLHLRQAEAYILQALRRDPDNPAYVDTYGWVLYMQEQYDLAEVQLRRALELLPDDPVINEHYGDVLHRLNRTREARAFWQKARDATPDPAELIERLEKKGIRLEITAETR